MQKVRKFFTELLRRKVVRLMGAYLVVLWLLAQGFADLFPAFGLPAWALPAFVVGGVALAPLLAWLSWKYDFTPPQLAVDPVDADAKNPMLGWALRRHDNTDAGYVLLKWDTNDGKQMEKRYFKAVSVGRGPGNDVQLIDERVSRFHAVLWAEDGHWHVKDGSTNGTYLNHARIAAPVALPPACELKFHANGPTVSVVVDRPAKTMVS
jgi:hypothetical protein